MNEEANGVVSELEELTQRYAEARLKALNWKAAIDKDKQLINDVQTRIRDAQNAMAVDEELVAKAAQAIAAVATRQVEAYRGYHSVDRAPIKHKSQKVSLGPMVARKGRNILYQNVAERAMRTNTITTKELTGFISGQGMLLATAKQYASKSLGILSDYGWVCIEKGVYQRPVTVNLSAMPRELQDVVARTLLGKGQ